MKIAIGSDHAGFFQKAELISFLSKAGFSVFDYGAFSEDAVDYPDIAFSLATDVIKKPFDFGILICGTGIGMCISANKIKGIRCALVGDTFSAEQTRKHNDANILAMGARIIDIEKMKEITNIFLSTEFEGGRHQKRVDKMMNIEKC